jgi:hypothetical protein
MFHMGIFKVFHMGIGNNVDNSIVEVSRPEKPIALARLNYFGFNWGVKLVFTSLLVGFLK